MDRTKETYRFWSLDHLYLEITKMLNEKGKPIPVRNDYHHAYILLEGAVFIYGLAEGKNYPSGSSPHLGIPVRNSYPAELRIITEKPERLGELERNLKIAECPKESRKKLKPLEKWDAKILKSN